VQGIGVDADQSYLGPHILTSAIKKVDVSVLDTVKQVQDSKFTGGADTTFDVKNSGAGLGKISPTGAKYQSQVDGVQQKLAAGSIQVPDTVK
jgi:basic membrane protein A